MRSGKRWLSGAALTLLGLGGAAEAQEFAALSDEITVTATRQERRVDEVPATVSVITAEEIEEQLATDIKDLVRFEPGVSVRSAPSRFTAAGANTGRDGNAGFNIRGLEGNRVLIQVDGVRTPDAFSFGGQAVGRGDYVDLDLLKSVEILRGPASALYGSDGVAGAVSFITKDPADFLARDEAFGGRARVAYASADESWAGGLVGAARTGAWSGLLAYTYRDAHEHDNQGSNNALNVNRTAPNPQDFETQSVLGKAVFAPSAAHTFRLTGEHFDREIVSEVFSARAAPPLAATSVIDLDALDTTERMRATFDYRYRGSGLIDSAFAAIYFQTSENREFADEDRNTAIDRIRINTFDNEVWGGSLQLDSDASFLGLKHSFVYGGDYSITRQEGVRDGTVPPAGEAYPTRAFPNTDYALAGAFLQDEISFMGGDLRIIPALRYDYYDLSPENDSGFTQAVSGQSDSRVSPKLGLVWWMSERFGAFANAAQGFKAPAPSQVNNGFTNSVAFYQAIPNPNLRPETSETIEIGLRFRDAPFLDGRWAGSLTGFSGQYEDFIEQVQVGGNFTPANPALFQFVNLSDVEIEGWEARLEGQWDGGFGLIFTASQTDGEQTAGGVSTPLNSVDPWKIVAGLTYRDPAGRFGGQVIATVSGEKEDADVRQNTSGLICPGNAACLFTPERFTVFDATAYWNMTDAATLRLGVFNITDETYIWWSDVRGVTAGSTVLDAYTQPGRNVSVSLAYRF